MSRETQALGIFAKEPRAGEVKTRLAAATSPAWAAQVAEAFLRDTLLRMADIPAERWLIFSPATAAAYFQTLAGDVYRQAPQSEGDLGQRLRRFFTERFALGCRQVIVIGADSPTLPPSLVEQAFAELVRADVVIGPATDGGYYLLGLSRPLDAIFAGVDWGGANVLQQTVARLPHEGCRLALLPPWYDVDTHDDLQALRGHIAALRRAGSDPQCPNTERLLGTAQAL